MNESALYSVPVDPDEVPVDRLGQGHLRDVPIGGSDIRDMASFRAEITRLDKTPVIQEYANSVTRAYTKEGLKKQVYEALKVQRSAERSVGIGSPAEYATPVSSGHYEGLAQYTDTEAYLAGFAAAMHAPQGATRMTEGMLDPRELLKQKMAEAKTFAAQSTGPKLSPEQVLVLQRMGEQPQQQKRIVNPREEHRKLIEVHSHGHRPPTTEGAIVFSAPRQNEGLCYKSGESIFVGDVVTDNSGFLSIVEGREGPFFILATPTSGRVKIAPKDLRECKLLRRKR